MHLQQLADALDDVRRNGVRVRVIVDEKTILGIGLALMVGISLALILSNAVKNRL